MNGMISFFNNMYAVANQSTNPSVAVAFLMAKMSVTIAIAVIAARLLSKIAKIKAQ